MKIGRIYTLDIEIVKKLDQIDNKSALIENLLRSYFDSCGNKSLSIEQKNVKMLKEMKEKAKLLKKDNQIIKAINKSGLDNFTIKRLLLVPEEINLSDNTQESITYYNELWDYFNSRKLKVPLKEAVILVPFLRKNAKDIKRIFFGEI